MKRDNIFELLDEMFEEIKTEVERVKSFEPLDWGRGVVYEYAWGTFHRYNGALSYAYRIGDLSLSEFLDYSKKSEILMSSMHTE